MEMTEEKRKEADGSGNTMSENRQTAQSERTKKLILSALFLAVGIILPFITMQIPTIGNMLCPMHIPVLLCGFVCGGPYGLAVGLMTPLVRSMLTGFPTLYPTAISMSIELAVYGGLTGALYSKATGRGKGIRGIYLVLLASMLSGRVVWGVASWILYRIVGNVFTWQIFAAQAFVNAIPGIVLQLVLIPMIVRRLQKANGEFLWS